MLFYSNYLINEKVTKIYNYHQLSDIIFFTLCIRYIKILIK